MENIKVPDLKKDIRLMDPINIDSEPKRSVQKEKPKFVNSKNKPVEDLRMPYVENRSSPLALPEQSYEEFWNFKKSFIDDWVTDQAAYTLMINNNPPNEVSLDDYILRSQEGLPVPTTTSFAKYDPTEDDDEIDENMGNPPLDFAEINQLSIQVEQIPIPERTVKLCNKESNPKNVKNKTDKKADNQEKKKKTRKETNSKRVKIS